MQILIALGMTAVAVLQTSSFGGALEQSQPLLVKSVINGDTIDVATVGRVRLLGIDAPAAGRGTSTPAPFGREALDRLTSLVLNRWVRLEREGASAVSTRRQAYVITGDGLFVNAALVREGLARVSARTAVTRLPELQRAEAEARAARRGIWGSAPPGSARGLYSGGSRHSCPGAEEPDRHKTEEAALSIPVEYASHRKIRERNKLYYRFNHWPIWIFVFFIAPGPLTFDLFERGFDTRMALWLGTVLIGTGIAGLRGRLPGVEPKPYIIRFTEDRPNPLYRRVCYTFAWSEVITFAVLNVAGLVVAIATGRWHLKEMYRYGYFPLAGSIWLLGAPGPAAAGEGVDQG